MARPGVACLEPVYGRAAPDAPERGYDQMRCTDVLPRFAREHLPTIASSPPNQIVKPAGSSSKRRVYDRAAAPIRDYREEDGSRNVVTIRRESRLRDSNLAGVLQAVAVRRKNDQH
jgi:hypothetical protein